MPLLEPEVGLTVNQAASDDNDHDVFDVTDTDVDPAEADGTDQLDTPTVNDGVTVATPGCVTDTVRVTCGVPLVVVNVTVADRADVAVLACADKVTVPLLEPEVGLTVNQAASDDTDHDVFDVTDTAVDPAEADGTDQLDTPTVNDGVTVAVPGWVTVSVCVTCGEPLVVRNSIVAVRAVVARFA